MPEESRSSRVSPSPSAYREKNPYKPPPPDYKPPSMLAQYKGLAIFFAAVGVAFAAYCLKGPTRPRDLPPAPQAVASPAPASPAPAKRPSAAPQPIYIETLPEKDAR